MLYHASRIRGLKCLQPRVSTHGAAFVYAIRNKVTAVCFGAKKDDFDLLMDEVDDVPHLYECYPGAMEAIYGGKSCALYTVGEEGFLSGVTGWDAELVSEHEAAVMQEENIDDIAAYLENAARRGECVIHRYSEDRQYQTMLREELGERIRDFDLGEADIKKDPRLKLFSAPTG